MKLLAKLLIPAIILPILLSVSMFVGVVIIAVGFGGAFPSVNTISQPLVCDGKITIESKTYSYHPGERITYHSYFCESAEGNTKDELGNMPILVSGLIYGSMIFIVLAIMTIAVYLILLRIIRQRK